MKLVVDRLIIGNANNHSNTTSSSNHHARTPPTPPKLNETMSESQSLYVMYDPEMYETASSSIAESFVSQDNFVGFVCRLGPLRLCLDRALENFIVNGRVVPWYFGYVSRGTAENAIQTSNGFESVSGGNFLIRCSKNKPNNFIISVHVKSITNGKSKIKHQLIYNAGSKGFSPTQIGTSGNTFVPTIEMFLGVRRDYWRRPITYDVFNYLSKHVIQRRIKCIQASQKCLEQQSLVVKSVVELNERVDGKRFAPNVPTLIEHFDKIGAAFYQKGRVSFLPSTVVHEDDDDDAVNPRERGKAEDLENGPWGKLTMCLQSRIDEQSKVLSHELQVLRGQRKELTCETITRNQFTELEACVKLESRFLTLLRRSRDMLSLNLKSSSSTSDATDTNAASTPQDTCKPCDHPFLELWMPQRHFHCAKCKLRIVDKARLEVEEEWIKKIHEEDVRFFLNSTKTSVDDDEDDDAATKEETEDKTSRKKKILLGTTDVDQHNVDVDKSAADAIKRGVTIKWLLDWTERNKCWEMPTWQVKRDFIMDATSTRRCRYVDLPEIRASGAVGKAQTFVSHCWGAKWGILVAAIAGHSDPNRRVWIDIFAVRQWPGNDADLNFDGVIERCSSFLLVCASVASVSNMLKRQARQKKLSLIPKRDRQKIAFYRVWCLVEIAAAFKMHKMGKLNIVMKCGSLARVPTNVHDLRGVLRHDRNMIHRMSELVDVRRADATVEEDRIRILNRIGSECVELNRMVRATCLASHSSLEHPEIIAAACGDLHVSSVSSFLEREPERAMYIAAGGGYENVVKYLLTKGTSPGANVKEGRTPLHRAAIGGNADIITLLLDASAQVDSHDGSGFTPLMYAASNGHADAIRLLLRSGAEINRPSVRTGDSALLLATKNGHADAVEVLLEAEDIVVDFNGFSGETPLIVVAKAESTSQVDGARMAKMLIDAGASLSHTFAEKTPLMWAQLRQNESVADVIRQAKEKDEYAAINKDGDE